MTCVAQVREEMSIVEQCNFTTSTTLVIPGVSSDEIRLSVNRALEGIEDLRQERYVTRWWLVEGVRLPTTSSRMLFMLST
jgi:hypothetical protein